MNIITIMLSFIIEADTRLLFKIAWKCGVIVMFISLRMF